MIPRDKLLHIALGVIAIGCAITALPGWVARCVFTIT